MSPKQISDWPLDPSEPVPVSQDVVEVDERGRLRLPARLRSSVGWLAKEAGAVDALMVLDEPGRIVLLSWGTFGEAVLARRRALIREVERGDAGAEHDLLLLEDRYDPVSIPQEYRLTLKGEWLLHLGLEERVHSRVYVERVFDRVVIMTKAYRDQRLRSRSVALSDLP